MESAPHPFAEVVKLCDKAKITVRIADTKDNTLIETLTNGPYLFANLKPGNYIISAAKDGNVMRQKAKIRGREMTSLSFYYPVE